MVTNAPDDFEVNGRKMHVNEISWIQRIRRADGRTEEQTLLSRYRNIPLRVLRKFAKKEEEERVEL